MLAFMGKFPSHISYEGTEFDQKVKPGSGEEQT